MDLRGAIKAWFKGLMRERRHQHKHAHARVHIVSYPKSGRTLLMSLIGRTLCDANNLSEYLLGDSYALTEASGALTTVFTHDGCNLGEARHFQKLPPNKSFYRGRKVIFLYRDPRDVVVSCYNQVGRRKGQYKGSVAEFIRSPHYGINKVVAFYNLWHKNRGVPEEFLLIRYEDIHEFPRETLEKALDFIDAPDVDDEILDNVVRYARLKNRQRLEKEGRSGRRKTFVPPRDPVDDDSIDLDDFLGDDEDEEEAPRSRRPAAARRPAGRKPGDRLHRADFDFMNRVLEKTGCPFYEENRRDRGEHPAPSPNAEDWT